MTEDETRESIARFLEHYGRCEFGSLLGALTPFEVATYAASWVRNRLDVKWAEELAANTPERAAQPEGVTR